MGGLIDVHLRFIPTKKLQFLQPNQSHLAKLLRHAISLVRKGCLEDGSCLTPLEKNKDIEKRKHTPSEDPV